MDSGKFNFNCKVASFRASNIIDLSIHINPIINLAGKDLVVLAYIHDQPEGTANPAPPHASGQRPEVRILTRENEELTSDALSVNGFQQYQAKDYRLIHAPFMGSSEKGGQWSAGDEPLYYIVSPKVSCCSHRFFSLHTFSCHLPCSRSFSSLGKGNEWNMRGFARDFKYGVLLEVQQRQMPPLHDCRCLQDDGGCICFQDDRVANKPFNREQRSPGQWQSGIPPA